MRFGVDVSNFGDYANPGTIAELARDAENAGWDGFFVFDHILPTDAGTPLHDPWITLAAVATATSRIRIGPMVTPLPRRRPWKLARETVTLDHLSRGRLILGVGLGGPPEREFERFGESSDPRVRAERLEEGLEILTELWSGRPLVFEGKHYNLSGPQFLPSPLQVPRIPIWVGAKWRNRTPLRRAARWDGVFPIPHQGETIRPDDLKTVISYVQHHRGSLKDYEVIVADHDGERSPQALAAYSESGLTWWLQRAHYPWTRSLDETRMVIRRGPPRP